MRRDLVILLCQGKERSQRQEGAIWVRRRLDVHGDLRRYQTSPGMAYRQTRPRERYDLYEGLGR